MWAPHTHISSFYCGNTSTEPVTDTGRYFHILIQTAGDVSHILISQIYYFHTDVQLLHSKFHVQPRTLSLFLSGRRGQRNSYTVTGWAKDTRIKRWQPGAHQKVLGIAFIWEIQQENTADSSRKVHSDFSWPRKRLWWWWFLPALSNALSTLSLVLAGWASSGNWPDWEIILQNRKDGWSSPGLKHCMVGARSMQTQISPLFSGTTGGPHTQLWMLLTANLNMVSLLTVIQPNIREQWRKRELTYTVNYQNYEFYICSKQSHTLKSWVLELDQKKLFFQDFVQDVLSRQR